MHKVLVALCTVLLLLAGQLPAAYAQPSKKSKKPPVTEEKSNYFYLLPTLGVYTFGSGDDFKTGPLYGLLFGYQLKGYGVTDRLGLEGFAAAIDTRSRKDDQAVNGYLLRAEAIYDLKKGRFVPFLSLGAGYLLLDADTRFIVTPGVGIKYALNNNFDLRADLRRSMRLDFADIPNNEFTIGLNYLFGKKRTVASPPPPDTDGDKVADGVDKCPDTPRGKKVDQFGCPQDTDGDGVPDFSDKCADTTKGAKVDLSGCATDNDDDAVPNDIDLCPATPPGIKVDAQGCVPTPELTRIPAAALSPAISPEIITPGIIATPGKIATPEIITAPGIIAAPRIIATPDSATPDSIASPEGIATPSVVATPGGVATPGVVAAPGAAAPAIIATQGVIATPGIIAAPEVITAPEIIAAVGLERIFFKFDSYALDEKAKRTLRENAKWLQANPGTRINIEGYCDVRGSDAYNIALGDKRAKAARAYLLTLGIAAERLSVTTYGEEKPLDPTPSEAAMAKNRRVDFVLQ